MTDTSSELTDARRDRRRRDDRQRCLRHPHHPVRDRPPRPAGRRLRRGLPRRRDHDPLGHDRLEAAQGQPRLLPPHGRRRGAHVRRGSHPRLVLPSRGPPVRGRDPHLPPDRPPAAPVLRQGPAQRGPGRRDDHVAAPRRALRRRRDQRGLDVDACSPACRSPARSAPPASPTSTALGRLPDPHPARAGHLRHGRRRPRARRRRGRDHDGRGRGHEGHLRARRATAPRRPPRTSSPPASRPPSPPSASCAAPSASSPRRPPSPPPSSRASSTTPTTCSPPSRPPVPSELAKALTIAGKPERDEESDRVKAEALEKLAGAVRGSREGGLRRLPQRSPRSWSASASCATRSASTAVA